MYFIIKSKFPFITLLKLHHEDSPFKWSPVWMSWVIQCLSKEEYNVIVERPPQSVIVFFMDVVSFFARVWVKSKYISKHLKDHLGPMLAKLNKVTISVLMPNDPFYALAAPSRLLFWNDWKWEKLNHGICICFAGSEWVLVSYDACWSCPPMFVLGHLDKGPF